MFVSLELRTGGIQRMLRMARIRCIRCNAAMQDLDRVPEPERDKSGSRGRGEHTLLARRGQEVDPARTRRLYGNNRSRLYTFLSKTDNRRPLSNPYLTSPPCADLAVSSPAAAVVVIGR